MVNARVGIAIRSTMAGALLLALGGSAGAQVAGSAEAAAFIVFPKVVVDSSGELGPRTDTLIQITNTDLSDPHALSCTWVNATSRCNAPSAGCPTGIPDPGVPGAQGAACDTNADCNLGLQCSPCWSENDFPIFVTTGQPLAFYASTGQPFPHCFQAGNPPQGCPEANLGAIAAVQEDPFRGELKCFQVRGFDDDRLDNRNDFKGEATIISGDGTSLQSAAYNAFGFQTAAAAPGTDADAPLCLGGPLADPCGDGACGLEYAACPGVLIVNHFFEFAPDPLGALTPPATSFVRTDLTLTPCTEAIFSGDSISDQVITTAQMLIYNEFEQRYSSSTRVQCYKDIPLADIDTRPGPGDDAFSIFAVGVAGTLTGQTRIRGVAGTEDDVGHGLIGVAHERYFTQAATTAPAVLFDTAAFDLHMQGEREQGDAVCRN
jgi:hypothetical protein